MRVLNLRRCLCAVYLGGVLLAPTLLLPALMHSQANRLLIVMAQTRLRRSERQTGW